MECAVCAYTHYVHITICMQHACQYAYARYNMHACMQHACCMHVNIIIIQHVYIHVTQLSSQ